jgi:hypothetical protein
MGVVGVEMAEGRVEELVMAAALAPAVLVMVLAALVMVLAALVMVLAEPVMVLAEPVMGPAEPVMGPVMEPVLRLLRLPQPLMRPLPTLLPPTLLPLMLPPLMLPLPLPPLSPLSPLSPRRQQRPRPMTLLMLRRTLIRPP